MSEWGLLPETQWEEPVARAPCPALPLTFKVTLGWGGGGWFNSFLLCGLWRLGALQTHPWGLWALCSDCLELHGALLSFLCPLVYMSTGGPLGKSVNKGCQILGSSSINGINDSIISQKEKQWMNIYNAFSWMYHIQPMCKKIIFP